jgi:hypothetical protein
MKSSQTFAGIVDGFGAIVTQTVLPLLFAAALVYFLIGVIGFIKNAGEEKARDESKKMIFAGLIGLAVMVSLWGLVAIVTGSLGEGLILPQINPNNIKGGNINSGSFR